MSTNEKSMSQMEIHVLLQNAEIGRLGLYGKEHPYIVPVNFSFVNGNIYFHGSFEGKKLDLIKMNNRVCFEVDTGLAIPPEKPGDCSYSYRSVIVYGEARLLGKSEADKFMDAAKNLFEKYATSHVPEISEELMEKTQMVEISIHKATGKKSTDQCTETEKD